MKSWKKKLALKCETIFVKDWRFLGVTWARSWLWQKSRQGVARNFKLFLIPPRFRKKNVGLTRSSPAWVQHCVRLTALFGPIFTFGSTKVQLHSHGNGVKSWKVDGAYHSRRFPHQSTARIRKTFERSLGEKERKRKEVQCRPFYYEHDQ